jgi:hypothetical protein
MESTEAAERVNKMWQMLGETIEAGIQDMALDDPAKAIRYACAVEACFWKATGECDTHDVKEVLPLFPSPQDTTEPSNG